MLNSYFPLIGHSHSRYQEEMHGCLHQSVMVYLVFWFNGFLQTYVSTIPFR